MRIHDIILKKRNGDALSRGEITHFVKGVCRGDIPDYQAAALLMAIWFRGMDRRETAELTLAMRDSGDVMDLSEIPGVKVDKHSTGGVGDTTSLIVLPLVAACGGKVPKMSGRGLGHTGGTLDKLEAIPGFSVALEMADFARIVASCGWAIVGQNRQLVPADQILYALRSVTGTVDNISLIAGSIMSKKLAAGADAIVLDVKTGSGSFMTESEKARELAETMVAIGEDAGRYTVAVITDMSQPLGNAVGNALEVKEAVEILQGKHEGDLKTVSMVLASRMLMASGLAADEPEACGKLQNALDSGKALDCFRDVVALQGGNPDVCHDLSLLPGAKEHIPIQSERSGYVHAIDAQEVGNCALLLGAGRLAKEDTVDPGVGVWMRRRLGDRVAAGDVLAEFYVNHRTHLTEAIRRFKAAIAIADQPGPELVLIKELMTP